MTKTEIIDAAFRVWGRNFYRKTSLSQLSGELGVTKTALYRHFNNKQALTDAMVEQFIDDFSASVRADFEKARQTEDAEEGVYTIIQSISGYFARNAYSLIFTLINIYNRYLDTRYLAEQLKSRGADMELLNIIAEKKYASSPVLTRLIFATITFLMSFFHKTKNLIDVPEGKCPISGNPPSEEEIQNITSQIKKTIKYGLGYSEDRAQLDFDKLEKQVEKTAFDTETQPFFKAAAEAVAEAGPWDVSMEMVAKRMGLSKSSLYGHCKNKKDMLRRLFISEFKRIFEFARMGIKLSDENAQQLYLGIYSIAVYLRSRPEILVVIDWIRTRRLDLGKPEKKVEIFRLFEDIDIEPLHGADENEKQKMSHWILYLLINILLHQRTEEKNFDIRLLFKFITLGLGGFYK